MTTSARWASGARSPEAPTEPCHGMTGCTPRSSSSHKRRQSSGRTRSGQWPAPPPGAATCRAPPPAAGARPPRRRGFAPGSAAARGWSPRRSAPRPGPEPGVHAVDAGRVVPAGGDGLDHRSRPLHPPVGRGGQQHLSAPPGHFLQGRQIERLLPQRQRLSGGLVRGWKSHVWPYVNSLRPPRRGACHAIDGGSRSRHTLSGSEMGPPRQPITSSPSCFHPTLGGRIVDRP
jgi:hypothetical protein